MITQLNKINTHIEIKEVTGDNFKNYGKLLRGYDFSDIIKYMEDESKMPEEGNIYKASVAGMEKYNIYKQLKDNFYGNMEIQIGYCNGKNSTLNGLEYHKGSEINVAVTDLVLLLGDVRDVNNNTYHTESVEAFYLPKGAAVELYQTTLHFAPCKLSDAGFKCIVILPKGTNTEIKEKTLMITEEDKLLFAKNKWLLAHPDRKQLVEKGAYQGIVGDNIQIKY